MTTNFRIALATYPAYVITAILAACLFYTNAIQADAAVDEPKHHSAVQASMKVLDDFMLAFNGRNMSAWSETLNYPHVRFASQKVRVWQTIGEFSATPPFAALDNIGWDHSSWISRKVVMKSPTKVHIATVFQRFNANNESIGVYESLYIVTQVSGHWGIQARSSLAP